MIHSRRLTLPCDVARLHADLDAVLATQWIAHFNTGYYTGDWSGVPLRQQPGSAVPLYADPTRDDFVDTDAMRRCTYVPELLAAVPATLQSVRFLRLAAGAAIREHRDFGLCAEEGAARLHIPVRTNPDVEFRVGHELLSMREGECWYVNFDLPHALANRGPSDRVHLVLDVVVDDAVRAWLGMSPAPIG